MLYQHFLLTIFLSPALLLLASKAGIFTGPSSFPLAGSCYQEGSHVSHVGILPSH